MSASEVMVRFYFQPARETIFSRWLIASERPFPEVCGKFQTCRPRLNMPTPLPAVSLREKGGVVRGFGICRILPFCDSGSAGKSRDLPTRPGLYTSATCGFVGKNRVVLGRIRFFPALPEMRRINSGVRWREAQFLAQIAPRTQQSDEYRRSWGVWRTRRPHWFWALTPSNRRHAQDIIYITK